MPLLLCRSLLFFQGSRLILHVRTLSYKLKWITLTSRNPQVKWFWVDAENKNLKRYSMNKQIDVSVRCPTCTQIVPVKVYRLLSVEDPHNLDLVLSDRVNVITCPKCNNPVRVNASLFCANVLNKFAIWYEPFHDPQIDVDCRSYSVAMGPDNFYSKAPRIADWGEFKRKLHELATTPPSIQEEPRSIGDNSTLDLTTLIIHPSKKSERDCSSKQNKWTQEFRFTEKILRAITSFILMYLAFEVAADLGGGFGYHNADMEILFIITVIAMFIFLRPTSNWRDNKGKRRVWILRLIDSKILRMIISFALSLLVLWLLHDLSSRERSNHMVMYQNTHKVFIAFRNTHKVFIAFITSAMSMFTFLTAISKGGDLNHEKHIRLFWFFSGCWVVLITSIFFLAQAIGEVWSWPDYTVNIMPISNTLALFPVCFAGVVLKIFFTIRRS